MTSAQERERGLEKASEVFTRQRQKDALASVLNRPLRADREAVSAAFSKWVRVTMFQLSGVSAAKADEANQLVQRQIEDDRMAFHQRENVLEGSRRKIEGELEESKAIENHLRSQLSQLHDEKEKLTEQVSTLKTTASSNGNGKSNRLLPTVDQMKERASLLADRESEVKRQELDLRIREQKVDGRERQGAAQSEELEDAHGRFRKLADQLRQKKRDIECREANLTSELSKCENTQSRLQKLAIQLQQKAEQLSHDRLLTTRRMEECDALESQLQQWQTQLEVPKAGHQE
jgi:chromosome segregation ATPase